MKTDIIILERKVKELINELASTLILCKDTKDIYAITRTIVDLNGILYRHEHYEKE